MPPALHGGRAHRPGRPEDEDPLSRSNVGLAQEVRSEEATVGNGRGFFVREVDRSRRQESVLRPAHVLCVRPEAVSIEAEYPVTHLERPDVRSDRVHFPGEHHAEYRLPRRVPAQCDPGHDPVSGTQPQPPNVAVARRHGSSPNPYPHLVLPGRRSRELLEPENLRRTVARTDDRSHVDSSQSADSRVAPPRSISGAAAESR
jgi:hypothetical protein